MTWQSMETAPKDGTWIIVWLARDDAAAMERDAVLAQWRHIFGYGYQWFAGWDIDKNGYANEIILTEPMHWAPISSPNDIT